MTIARNLSGIVRPTAFDTDKEQELLLRLAGQLITADSGNFDEARSVLYIKVDHRPDMSVRTSRLSASLPARCRS